MSIEQWWPKLKPSTRALLIDNNGDVVPADVIAEITEVSGSIASDASWVGEREPEGLYLSDDAVDWIEAAANDELPEID